MRQVLRRALPTALAGVLLAGCSAEVVVGQASPGPGEPVDVAADAFPITGVSDTAIDQFARNALTDLNTFWAETYPEFFGEDFTPLENGYFSVDSNDIDQGAYPETGIGCDGSPTDPDEVAGNAFYDPGCDLIAYDRALLDELSDRLRTVPRPGRHGARVRPRHAGPVRVRRDGRSIQDETQADCLAGAWTRWVADGERRARRDPHARARRRHPRVPAAARRRRQRPRRQPGARLLLRPRLRPSTRASTAAWARAGTTSATDRLFTAATFDPTEISTPAATRPSTTSSTGSATTLPEFWTDGVPGRLRQRLRRPPPSRLRRHGAGLRRASRTATSATAPTTTPSTYDETDLAHARLRRDRRLRARHRDLAALLAGRARPGRAVDRRRRRHPLGRLPHRLVRRPSGSTASSTNPPAP